jgi:signal transduction histidine kinase
LLAAFGALAVATTAAVSLLTAWSARIEVETILEGRDHDNQVVADVVEAFGGSQVPVETVAARSILAPLDDAGVDYAVVDGQGDVILRSPLPPDFRLTVRDDGTLDIRISRTGPEWSAVTEDRVAPAVSLADASGAVAARLYILPAGPPPAATTTSRFRIRQWTAAIVVAALALLATAVVARWVLRPVEALEDAARRMTDGDLAARVAVTGRDELADLGHAFNRLAARLESQDGLRRSLVADVAHELRTPLTAIRCQVEALEDGFLEADAGTVVSLRSDVAVLERLVDDLQDLATAESGALELRRRPVAVAEAVREAVSAVVASGTGAGAVIRIDTPPELAAEVDPDRFRQILVNLLANAVAYTPSDGSIVVAAVAAGDEVRLSVRDTGCGIAADHLPNIFERFYRVDPSRDRATGGAGVGLTIVRRLAEAHGGSVCVESEICKGSVFTVTLPGAAVEEV